MLSLLVGSKDNILASSCWLNAAYAVFRHTFWSAFKHYIHVFFFFSRAGAFKFISRTTTVNFSQQGMYNLHIILILLLFYFYFRCFVPLQKESKEICMSGTLKLNHCINVHNGVLHAFLARSLHCLGTSCTYVGCILTYQTLVPNTKITNTRIQREHAVKRVCSFPPPPKGWPFRY